MSQHSMDKEPMDEDKDLQDTIQAILDEPEEPEEPEALEAPDEPEEIDSFDDDSEDSKDEEVNSMFEEDHSSESENTDTEIESVAETESLSEISQKEHDLMLLVAKVIAKGITRQEHKPDEEGEVLSEDTAENLGLETAEQELEESEEPEKDKEKKKDKEKESDKEEQEKEEAASDAEPKSKKPKFSLRERIKKFHRFKTKKALIIALAAEILLVAGTSGIIVATIHTKEFQERQKFISAQIAVEFLESLPGRVQDVAERVYDSARDAFREYLRNRLIQRAANLEFIAPESNGNVSGTDTYQIVASAYSWGGARLSRSAGAVTGPNGRETYYNLDMSVIVSMMQSRGTPGGYWVRSDGVKMYGNYVMCAANLNVHPRGSIVRSSVGLAIVVDTGGFAASNPNQLDIATTW